jgi:hypothetical protein
MSAEPAGRTQSLLRAAADNRGFRVPFAVTASLLLLIVVAELGLTVIGPQVNFQTLQGDLAKVHLAPGYRLATEDRTGTDCHTGCTLRQIWTWGPTSGRTKSAACTDVSDAMTSAFSDMMTNSEASIDASCDYFAAVSSLLHPGQGKRTVEAVVQAGQDQTSDAFLIVLTASYL